MEIKDFICFFDYSDDKYKIISDESKEVSDCCTTDKLFYCIKKFLCQFNDDALYRGQNDKWTPEASIFRKEYSHLKENEDEYCSNVRKDHDIELGNIKGKIHLYSKIQHFGYPTRLLDVTSNKFKALAFMIDKIDEVQKILELEPCIYIFEPKNGTEKFFLMETEKDNVGAFAQIIPTNNQNENIRLHAQSGLFIYFNEDEKDISEYYDVTRLKLKLKSEEDIKHIEEKLSEFHYGVDTLYPDMIKRSEYYKKKWKVK